MSDVYVVSVTEVCLVSVYYLSMENCRVIPRKKTSLVYVTINLIYLIARDSLIIFFLGKFSTGDLFGSLLSMKTCNSDRYGSSIHAWPAQLTLPYKAKPDHTADKCLDEPELQMTLTFTNSQRKRDS